VDTVEIRSCVRIVALAKAAALGVKAILSVFVLMEIVLPVGRMPTLPSAASDGAGDRVTEYISAAITKVSKPTAAGIKVVSGEKDAIREKCVLPNFICLLFHRVLSKATFF